MMMLMNNNAAVVQYIELAMISINSKVLISDGSAAMVDSASDDSDDDHSDGRDNCGR